MVTKSLLRVNSAVDSHAERRVCEGPAVTRCPIELLIRKLESIGTLSPAERDALRGLETSQLHVNAHHDVFREGDRPSAITLVLHGLLCRYKIVADGKRQIMSFHIPGDLPDLPCLVIPVMDHNLCSLVASELALIPRVALLDLLAEQPQLASLFWRDTLVDAAIFREWMVGIGRRSAFTRIAHLFCEMIVRMRAVGLSSSHTVELPVTQTDIADALGLSTVHVNRTLQELRGAGLIRYNRGTLVAIDWPGLRAAGEFEHNYLHEQRAGDD
jgi:CRP-like cAMP-binding protein